MFLPSGLLCVFKSIYLNIHLPTTGCLMAEELRWECKTSVFKQWCSLLRCAGWGDRWAWMNESSWPSQNMRNCLHLSHFQQSHDNICNAFKQIALKHNGFIPCEQELLFSVAKQNERKRDRIIEPWNCRTQNSPGCNGPRKIFWSNVSWERKHRTIEQQDCTFSPSNALTAHRHN